MSAMREDRNLRQVVMGLGVLVAGLLFTLDNMGIIDVRDFIHYWPIVFIAIGVSQIIQARYWSAYAGAVIWMLAGVWFLGRTTGVIRVGLGDVLPMLLSALGAFLVFRGWHGYGRSQRHRDGAPHEPGTADRFDFADDGWETPRPAPAPVPPQPAPRQAERPTVPLSIPPTSTPSDGTTNSGGWARSSDNTVNLFVVMGGVSRRLMTQDFKGGTAVAIMGGCKIDLRDASISQGDAVIDVLAFWGGVEIKVPEGWTVVPQVFPFMGGFDDRTRPVASATRQRLIVRGLAFMGGIEVKH